MGTIIQTELQKLKRRKLVWGILVLTTLIALFAFERACSISRKSAIMDSFGDYYTLAFKTLATIYLPIVLGIFATSLFFDEYKNDTLKSLLIVPISKAQLYFSKIAAAFFMSLGLCLYTFILTVFGGVMAGGFPDINGLTVLQAFALFAEGGILVPLAMLPVIFLTVLGRKDYILPIAATLLYLVPVILIPSYLMGIHPLASAINIYRVTSPAAAQMVKNLTQGANITANIASSLINMILIGCISAVLSVIALQRRNN